MLFRPESLAEFAAQSPQLAGLFAVIEEMAAASRGALGAERLAWLSKLPMLQNCGPVALVHASPGSPWRAPAPAASDAELDGVYGPLGVKVAVHGHIHRPYIRTTPHMTVANSGSVGLPYDEDPRAAYLMVDGSNPTIRRVAYDVGREIQALSECGLPHASWVAKMLATCSFQMP
jgi:hypothetical protein